MMVEQKSNKFKLEGETPEGTYGSAKMTTTEMDESETDKDKKKDPEEDSASAVPKKFNPGPGPRSTPANMIPREMTQYAPLLVGKYYIQDKKAVWSGKWGMTEAAFGEKGITSAFEMKSQEDVLLQISSGSPEESHPAFEGIPLARTSSDSKDDASEVNPVLLGYETNPENRSAMPFANKYGGFFQIQAVKGKPQTVTEKDVEIRFVHDPSCPSQFIVSGSGINRFGIFDLHGTLDKATQEMRVYKVYKPPEREKRTLPRRARTARAAAQVQAKPPKPAPKQPTPPVAAPTAPVAPPAPVKSAPVANGVKALAKSVSLPVAAKDMPTLARNRSERKRVVPAHLRDENVIEHDNVPVHLRKCHNILKSLCANPKAAPFLAPVDPVALAIPDYFKVIKEPMDLGTIRRNLEGGFYNDPSVFADHVRLTFNNAMLYNAAHSQVHQFAVKLLEDFEKRMKSLNVIKQPKSHDKAESRKLKKERKSDSHHLSGVKKVKGGKGSKGNSKRRPSSDDQGLIMALKEDIERLKATLEQLQPVAKVLTPKPPKRPFRMEDLTEEELNEPMTQLEKARLSADIKALPQDKINRVLQIIAEAVPVAKLANENDEVELDINAFDTRCLRMLEGYVRENGIGRKRKRPLKKPKVAAPVNRLKSAKVAAMNIRYRKEELKSQLAAIDGEFVNQAAQSKPDSENASIPPPEPSPAVPMEVDEPEPKDDDNSDGDGSSSGTSSSDSDSDSDSESDSDSGAQLQRSPSLFHAPALSSIAEHGLQNAAKKIKDELPSEPLKVENRGAWSLLAQKDASNDKSPMQSEESQTSSLWLSARSMEQIKQQKLQQKEKERFEELEAQRRREHEQREKEKEREREETDRQKREQETSLRLAEEERLREERAREAERYRANQRAVERAKLDRENEMEQDNQTLSEDLESFSSSSFL